MTLINNIINSPAFKKIISDATKIASKRNRLFRLIQSAVIKIRESSEKNGGSLNLQKNAQLLLRLLVAFYKGEYRDVSRSTILKIVIAIVYLVSVIDFIPDFIFGIGLLDDAAVIVWIMGAIQEELQKFEAWETASFQNSQTQKEETKINI